jgi:trehalose 6-phosphate phosphatase
MRHLFTPEGDAALAAFLQQPVLLAFDFDGTLAPIVSHPGDARPSPTVSARLHELSKRMPVAIVTGRAVDDVLPRLGFEPHWVVGNHGAEDDADPHASAALIGALEPARELVRQRAADLAAADVMVEDKGQSMAWHYRLSKDRDRALALIGELLPQLGPGLSALPGKLVVNVVAADAPDKATAVHRLVARAGVEAAFFAGDDVNDEPVFAAAEPHWLTIRVGSPPDPASAARFGLDSPAQLAMLLDRIDAWSHAAVPE